MEDKERRLQELARKVLEEDALGDIGDTSDTEIEKSDYEGRGSPCSQNTVLHMRQPRDEQSKLELRNSRAETPYGCHMYEQKD